MHTLLHDFRYALRTLLRQPVFAVVALFTLALGIGANTAMFSLIDAVLLHPLAYPDADRLVNVLGYAPERGRDFDGVILSVPRYEILRDQQTLFEDLGASTFEGFSLTGRGEPAQLNGCYIGGHLLQTLSVPLAQGRFFLPEEDRPGGPPVVILSQGCWQKRFGGDPSVLGQTVPINNVPRTVVGILAPGVSVPYDQIEVWLPGVRNSVQFPPVVIENGGAVLLVTGRLKPGIGSAEANRELERIARRYQQVYPTHVDGSGTLRAVSLQEGVVGDSRPMFYTLAGAVSCVLLIACVNVANLLLARVEGRRREIAIRAALGAGRWRLARQFLTESLLLTLLAGVLGTLLALWGVDLARSLGTEVIPRAGEVRLSGETLLFTVGVSVVAGLLLGVAPALHAAGGNTAEALQQSASRGSAGGVRQGRARAALLVAQVALSLVLLTGTGLLLRSLWQLQRAALGFNPDGVLNTNVNLPPQRYATPEQQANFFARLMEGLDALPGVRCSAVTNSGPLADYTTMFYSVVGQPVPPIERRAVAKFGSVSPDYFTTVEIPLRRGRGFTERDRLGAPPVMLINETLARQLFPAGDAIGQKLLCTASNPTVTEIVGIVGDARTNSPAKPARPEMYFSVYQRPAPYMNVYLRAIKPEQAKTLGPALRAAVREVDPDQPVGDVLELNTVVTRSVADRRLMAGLLASFAGLALVLAAIGIYGVTAYGVAQRTREIGIRLALGAQRGDVFRLIVGGGMKLIGVGIALGVVVALGLTRLLASLLYGVGASDPLTFVAVVLVLTLVALLANYLPARRATLVDPLTALRDD